MAFAETVPRKCLGAEVTCWQRLKRFRDVRGMVGRYELLRHLYSGDNPRSAPGPNRKSLILNCFQSRHWRCMDPETVS